MVGPTRLEAREFAGDDHVAEGDSFPSARGCLSLRACRDSSTPGAAPGTSEYIIFRDQITQEVVSISMKKPDAVTSWK